ncbi:hypothetical protein ACTJIL_10890 [Luteimonas sp. 22616]|uniref:hypothetical protein n=1 Tax=Luteimonas sp. 22616 TaxID=3453951 RepID=UPI003F8654D0
MSTDWNTTLARIASAIGSGLLWLGRHLLALLVVVGRFIVLRAIPALWAWLRGTAFPALHRFYLWLPHRRLVVATAFLLIAAGGLWMFKATPPVTGSDAGNHEPIQVATREARLVDQLLSDDWQAQKAATRTILEAVGAQMVADDVLVPDGDGLFVTSPELVMLAMDGARKTTTSRLTLAELAFMLQDFGFPFPEDQLPPKVLENGVRTWVQKSLQDPRLPGAASARFLHAMAARQMAPIDLASPDWRAEQHALTHLELFAFFAAFADGSPGVSQQAASHRRVALPGMNAVAAASGHLLDAVVPAAHASGSQSTECSPLADHYKKMGKKLDFEQNNKTMEAVLNVFGNAADGAGSIGKAAAKALEAINYAFKVQKLMLLYSSIDMRLTADTDFVHKPHPGEADKEVTFKVTVGMDEEKYREFVQKLNSSESGKALKACLASLGLPSPSDMADIIKEMKDWEVEWRLDGGNSMWTMFETGHASWDREKNGFTGPNHSREKLSPIDATHVGADFIVDIARETLDTGDILSANVTGQAILRTDGTMPGTEVADSLKSAWKTWMDGDSAGAWGLLGTVLGGLGTTQTEVASNWARRILDPAVFSNITVAYHKEVIPDYTYEGTVSAVFHSVDNSKSSYRRDEDYEKSEVSRHSQGSLTANVRTIRMTPYMKNEGTDVWEMEGDGKVSGSYQYTSKRDALVSCNGVMLKQRKEMRKESGRGGSSASGTYSMRLEQSGNRMRGGDYQLRVILMGAGVTVPYHYSYTDTGQAGCEFSVRNGWSRNGNEEKSTSVGTTGGFSHVIKLEGLYPETIRGRETVAETPRSSSDGTNSSHEERATTWSWNLRRVDPPD